MAEKPKEDMQESDTGSVNIDKKKENSDSQSPVKSVNGAKDEAEVEKSAVPPVEEVGESADKETTTKEGESPAQNEEMDVKSNSGDEQEDGAEGSKLYKCWALFCEWVHHRCVD